MLLNDGLGQTKQDSSIGDMELHIALEVKRLVEAHRVVLGSRQHGVLVDKVGVLVESD